MIYYSIGNTVAQKKCARTNWLLAGPGKWQLSDGEALKNRVSRWRIEQTGYAIMSEL